MEEDGGEGEVGEGEELGDGEEGLFYARVYFRLLSPVV